MERTGWLAERGRRRPQSRSGLKDATDASMRHAAADLERSQPLASGIAKRGADLRLADEPSRVRGDGRSGRTRRLNNCRSSPSAAAKQCPLAAKPVLGRRIQQERAAHPHLFENIMARSGATTTSKVAPLPQRPLGRFCTSQNSRERRPSALKNFNSKAQFSGREYAEPCWSATHVSLCSLE